MKTNLFTIFVFGVLVVLGSSLCAQDRPNAQDRVVLRGYEWLDGYGVDVIYPPQGVKVPVDSKIPVKYGSKYHCSELAERLYDRSGLRYGKWEILSPVEMIDIVLRGDACKKDSRKCDRNIGDQYYREFQDLSYFSNGSATPPRPGDILISADGGHVMIINYVEDNQIEVVEQNLGTGRRILNLQRSKDGYKIEGSKGWIHSPRMENLLRQTNK